MSPDDMNDDEQSEDSDITPRERKLITQSYDLSISTLLEQWTDGTLALPEIQRQYVWDNSRASRLIESLLLNIPIPVVYFAETEDVNYLVIDGHQRIKSIARFLSNEFALSGLRIVTELNKKRFHQLPERDQRQIRTRVIRAIIISADSDPTMRFEVFERLNTGSIALNAQEVRNTTHRGRMNELIKNLTTNSDFRSCVATAKPRPRMADNELILRHLALQDMWRDYKPPMSRYLNNYMTAANKYSDRALTEVEEKFVSTSRNLCSIYTQGAFRLTDSKGHPTDKAINRALAEVQLTAFSWVSDPTQLTQRRPEVLEKLGALNKNQLFLDSIQRATGDRKRTYRRLGLFCDALESAGISLTEAVEYEID